MQRLSPADQRLAFNYCIKYAVNTLYSDPIRELFIQFINNCRALELNTKIEIFMFVISYIFYVDVYVQGEWYIFIEV